MAKGSGMGPVMVVGSAVCKAVGLDPNDVRSFTLRAAVNEVMTITIELFPSMDDAAQQELGEALAKTLQFEVREVEEVSVDKA